MPLIEMLKPIVITFQNGFPDKVGFMTVSIG